ncbi:hypothetical protein M8J77_006224 [Diaphorina citri]|nr:hypothetical protein M8J77_006224 [Diaphorina citri]
MAYDGPVHNHGLRAEMSSDEHAALLIGVLDCPGKAHTEAELLSPPLPEVDSQDQLGGQSADRGSLAVNRHAEDQEPYTSTKALMGWAPQ